MVTDVALPAPHIHPVTEVQLAEFELAIATACALASERPILAGMPEIPDGAEISLPDRFKDRDGSLVLSFDSRWYPFLNNGRGHHVGQNPRWYIPNAHLLKLVVSALKTPDELERAGGVAGGRVFLSAVGARRRLLGSPETTVLLWHLPRRSVLLG